MSSFCENPESSWSKALDKTRDISFVSRNRSFKWFNATKKLKDGPESVNKSLKFLNFSCSRKSLHWNHSTPLYCKSIPNSKPIVLFPSTTLRTKHLFSISFTMTELLDLTNKKLCKISSFSSPQYTSTNCT